MYDRKTIVQLIDILIPEGDNGEPPASKSRGADFIAEYITNKCENYIEIAEMLTVFAGEKNLNEETLKQFEKNNPEAFGLLINVVYTAYYGDPVIVEKLKTPEPPQPSGHSMKPFDIKLLDVMLNKKTNL